MKEQLKTKYIECICSDFDHVSRLLFDDFEQEMYLEFKLIKFPGQHNEKSSITIYKPNEKFKNFFRRFKWKYYRFSSYLTNVYYAVCGRPNWFSADAIWNIEQIKEVQDFLKECLKGKNDKRKNK